MFSQLIKNYPFLQTQIYNNTLFDWLLLVALFFVGLIIFKIIKILVISRIKKISRKTKNEIDDIAIDSIESIYWPFYAFLSLYLSMVIADIQAPFRKWIYYLFITAAVYYAIKAMEKFISFAASKTIQKRKKEGDENVGIIQLASTTARIIVWAIAIILILSNLGYDVTSLVAGLGIGGIAIALALQNILGDIFSSLSIYFDKPFKVGDFVVLGTDKGTVKQIGIKTTRIQALQGEELVIPNSEITNARVQNYGMMKKRRIVFNIGVTYNTPKTKLEKIPAMIKEILKKQKNIETERVHFKEFGDSALIFEVVFFVKSGDYKIYLDTQQVINLEIVKEFEKQQIEMAFPTQTLYLKK